MKREPTHAGGVVYRVRNGDVEYLLVGPKKEVANEWLLPKGHIREHEQPHDAALREIAEETGVKVRLVCPIDTVEFEAAGKTVRAKFYLMEAVSEDGPAENRRRSWFSFKEALRNATYEQTKQLLEVAEEKRTSCKESGSNVR